MKSMSIGIAPSEFFTITEQHAHKTVVQLKERLAVENSAQILKMLLRLAAKTRPPLLVLDLEKISYLDDYGALVLFEIKKALENRSSALEIVNPSEKTRQVLSLADFTALKEYPRHRPGKTHGPLVKLGAACISHAGGLADLTAFIGALVLSLLRVLVRPRRLRLNDTIEHMAKTGVEALPIVALISFLLGLIMAFMSSLQLQQFGANVYVASLVALAMVSELGPIMTAIIVAGRSGSAFAAEIGTMRINEEIDALKTMGFDPTIFLAVPRLLALVLVLPLLTVFSNLFAIGGGMMIGIFMLDLTPGAYMAQTVKTLTAFELLWGGMKSVVFAVLIAWIGCLRGFQARGGASSVGNAATSAVVTSIFLIILFDSIFAIIRSYWG